MNINSDSENDGDARMPTIDRDDVRLDLVTSLTGTEIKSPILSPALLSDRYSKGRYSEITESDDIV